MAKRDSNRGLDVLIGFFLMAVVFAVFYRVLSASLLAWDDDINILDNPLIRGLGWDHLCRILCDYSYIPRYMPLAWLMWAVVFHFFGCNASAYHALSLVLHALDVVLVFFVIRALLALANPTGGEKTSSRNTVCALVGALLWGVHPLRVEVVAWAATTMFSAALFCLLLSFLFYLRYASPTNSAPHRATDYTVSVGLFACSLLFYPVAAMYAVVPVLLDLVVFKRLSPFPRQWQSHQARWIVAEKIPFFLLTICDMWLNLWARIHAKGIWGAPSSTQDFTLLDRLSQAFYMWAHYLWKPFDLLHLSPIYTTLVSFEATDWPFVLSFCAVVAITVALLLLRHRWPSGVACWIAYLALLIPVLGLTEHPHYPADRYSYMVGILVSILIAAGLSALWHYPRARVCSLASSFALAGALGYLALRQTGVWHDSETLFQYVLANLKSDLCASDIHWRLGIIFAKQQKLADAQAQFETALSLNPDLGKAHRSLGLLFMIQGATAEAIPHLQEAARLNAGDAEAHRDLGVALARQRRLEEAIGQFQEALRINPSFAKAHNDLANALLQHGQVQEAKGHVETALQISPDLAEAHNNLGNILLKEGYADEAIAHFLKALEIRPDFADAHNDLGGALLQTGRLNEAIARFQEALKLNPSDELAQYNLANLFLKMHQEDRAIAQFQKALEIRPDFTEARNKLGIALLQRGQVDEAITQFQKALAIRPGFAEVHHNLGSALLKKGQAEQAIAHYTHAVLVDPKMANAHSDLGNLLLQQGRVGEALAHYQTAIELQPANAFFLNNLAWVLASCPDPSTRNGARALELALQAERLSQGKNPAILGTLAAAYAEAGRFPEALATARRALDLATSQTNSSQADILRANLLLYQAGRAFHDTPQANSPAKPDPP
jgi:tetratricopeptide (TPR) repeat protein